jgi:hypothetical protein
MTAECITEIPVEQVQIVEKQIPKITTEVTSVTQEVPQVLIEETLVEVPQVQMAEAIKQVPKVMVQSRQKGIPKITTQVVEKIQQVPIPLIHEVAMEVPQMQVVEVMKQTAALSQQRLVQQSRQYELPTTAYRTQPEERAGSLTLQTIGVRNAPVQPTVVERLSPVLTTGQQPLNVSGRWRKPQNQAVVEYASAAPTVEYVTAAPTTIEVGELMMGQVAETMVAPTTYYGAVEPMMGTTSAYGTVPMTTYVEEATMM